MGNEQAVPQQNQGNQTGFQGASDSIPVSQNSSQNYLLSNSFIQQSFTPDYKIAIVIRGPRKTGKTTLITRMRGFAFDPEYQATPSIETTEIPWRSPARENILVAAWDTVEHFLPQLDSKIQLDATNVDTIEKADAVVIMIDNRSEESINLAEKLIINAPDNLPLAVFSNFMDLDNSSPLIPSKLMQYMGRFFFIPGSLKTNQGLVELSKWLTLPLLAAKAKHAYSLHLSSEQETKALEDRFSKYTLDFLDLKTAISHINNSKKENSSAAGNSSSSASNEHGHTYKKAYQRRPLRRTQQNNNSTKETQQKTAANNSQGQNSIQTTQNTKSAEDSFWDDDDTNTKSNNTTRVVKRRVVRKTSNENDEEDEIIRPNPLVKPRKSSTNQIILQNNSSQPTISTPTSTSTSNLNSSQETETTKRRRIVKRKSTGISQQQPPQQTQPQQQSQQPQQVQQQSHTVVRRKKKVVRHSQNNDTETVTGNEQSVDGYESF